MKRCVNCVLSELTPNIVFDEKGVCNHCTSHSNIHYPGEQKLRELLNSHKRASSTYDCIIGISGGRDSTYALLKLVKDFDMKVLAINYQNPFTDPQATQNIENAVRILDVDLVQFKLRNDLHRKTFRHNLEVWLKKPSPAMIPMMCIACKTILAHIMKEARKNDINCISSI